MMETVSLFILGVLIFIVIFYYAWNQELGDEYITSKRKKK